MRFTENELSDLYRGVIEEYNRTPLAVQGGYFCIPSETKLQELKECLSAMSAEHSVFLDIGTGMGIAPRFFKKIGRRSITVDHPAAAQESGANAELAGIEIMRVDILRDPIPVPDASVDCILFADVIEHLLHSPKPALKEFWRVLKPNGVCIASTPNSLRLSARLRLFMGYSNWPALSDFYDLPYHGGHHHEYSPTEFHYAFQEIGFKVEKLLLHGTVATVSVRSFSDLQPMHRGKSDGSHPLINVAKLPIWLLERAVPNFRPSMLLVARKTEALNNACLGTPQQPRLLPGRS